MDRHRNPRFPGTLGSPAKQVRSEAATGPRRSRSRDTDVKVSTLVKLPDFIPGMGTLYVDPSTLPVGPFLGYNRKGKLVNIIYMVPMKDFEAHKNFDAVGRVAKGLKIDHISIQFNPGHPGVGEPNYHITQWLISPAAVKKGMQ